MIEEIQLFTIRTRTVPNGKIYNIINIFLLIRLTDEGIKDPGLLGSTNCTKKKPPQTTAPVVPAVARTFFFNIILQDQKIKVQHYAN